MNARPGHPILNWIVRSLIVATFLLSQTAELFAAKIKVETAVRQPSIVIGKPMLTWWDVRVEGTGLAVGQLEFFVKHNEQLLSVTQTDELTFSGSDQRIRVMLPAVRWVTPIDQLQVEIYFRTKDGVSKLEPQILRSPFMNKKVFIALVSDSRVLSSHSVVRESLLAELKIENLTTSERFKKNVEDDREHVKTIFAPIEAVDFPSDPHHYCCYDLVVVMGDELRSLRKGQLDALLAWVRAGGSLYVEPRGVLETIHTQFLTSLADEDPQGIVFQTEASGQLSRDVIPAGQFAATFDCGVGVAVVRTSEEERQAVEDDERWFPVAKSLWRRRETPIVHRPAQAQRFVNGNGGLPTPVMSINLDPYGTSASATSRTSLDQIGILERLKPDGVRMVPTWLLTLVLLLMIFLIGPVDYTVLGWLRLRKLTWLSFPLVTIATTALLVRVSDRFMSASEQVNATYIHDVNHSGSIVRTNRFELMYPTSSRRTTTEIQKGLFAPVIDPSQTQRLSGVISRDRAGASYVVVNGELIRHPGSGAVEYEGRIPSRYSVSQNVMKWTPQLYRILEIPQEPIPTKIDWDALRISRSDCPDEGRHEVPAAILREVQKQLGRGAHCAGFFGTSGWFHDTSEVWRPNFVQESHYLSESQKRQALTFNSVAAGEPAFLGWIHNASSASTNPGIFSLISQTSPTGDASCEDLMIYDSSNDQEWLLVVMVAHPNRYDVYRKRMKFID